VHNPDALTPAEAEAVAADIAGDYHYGAAPRPCWCSVPHAPGSAGTVSPPWENELPGAGLPAAPGLDVPARTASGAARAPQLPGGAAPPQAPPGIMLPVPRTQPPGGTGTDGDATAGAQPPARPAPGPGARSRQTPGVPPEIPTPGGNPALPPLPDSPSTGGRAAQEPLPGARSHTDASGGVSFREKWKAALAGNAKEQRRQRGRHRAEPGYRPGMNRRAPE
jgi:hypothetical protein